MTNLKYRPEIDGLRAIAVLAVIIYHAGFSLGGKLFLEGGFIGVDVFFVISGYLITLIILREIQSGGFTFFAFYERRARRILPVLFFVMLASAYFAWVYMTPDALLEYASSIIASLAFGSNFLFWLQDSYTAEPSALKPFLHTWSLSIEEQFYLFFPPILIVFTRYAKDKINLLILMLIVTSLVVAEFSSRAFPDAAFYLLPSRAWELLAGAFLAKMELDRGRLSNPSLGKLMPGLGLLLIILSIFIFDKETRHPSLITALPVVGTMLIIWFSSGKDWTGALLSSKPFVSIGLISYSLYLWHFPIFAFDKIINGEGADQHKIFNILMTFLLAVFSYFLIEKPARNRGFLRERSLLAALSTSLALLFSVNFYVLGKGGVVFDRGEGQQIFLNTAVRDNATLNGSKCHDYVKPCVIKPTKKKETIVLVGDSHAGAISGEFIRAAIDNGYGYAQFTSSACTHISGLYNPNRPPRFNERCEKNSQMFERFIREHNNLLIVHLGYYPFWLSGKPFSNGREVNAKTKALTVSEGYKEKSVKSVVSDEIRSWMNLGHRVVLIYPVPELGVHAQKYFSRLMQDEGVGSSDPRLVLSVSASAVHSRLKDSETLFDTISGERLIKVRPASVFCSDEDDACYASDGKSIYYTDSNHLSKSGSEKLVSVVLKKINSVF